VTTLRRSEAGAISRLPDLTDFVSAAEAKKNAEAEREEAKAEAKAETQKAPDGFNIRDWTADKYERSARPRLRNGFVKGLSPLESPFC
jgi:hypothetical protein